MANHSSVIEAESRIRTGPWYPALRVSPAAVEGASARWRWRGLPMGQAARPRLLRNNGSRAGVVEALQVPILSPDVRVALPSGEDEALHMKSTCTVTKRSRVSDWPIHSSFSTVPCIMHQQVSLVLHAYSTQRQPID
jgi:hypothetical protein